MFKLSSKSSFSSNLCRGYLSAIACLHQFRGFAGAPSASPNALKEQGKLEEILPLKNLHRWFGMAKPDGVSIDDDVYTPQMNRL
jgi:hypothetical protein